MEVRRETYQPVVPDAVLLSIVSGRLALAVSRSGMSRIEISARSGVSQAALSRYIRGERMISAYALVSLCAVLRVSSDWILGLDPRTQARIRGSTTPRESPFPFGKCGSNQTPFGA